MSPVELCILLALALDILEEDSARNVKSERRVDVGFFFVNCEIIRSFTSLNLKETNVPSVSIKKRKRIYGWEQYKK